MYNCEEKAAMGQDPSPLFRDTFELFFDKLKTIPEYNSLRKASALKVNAALSKFTALPVKPGAKNPSQRIQVA